MLQPNSPDRRDRQWLAAATAAAWSFIAGQLACGTTLAPISTAEPLAFLGTPSAIAAAPYSPEVHLAPGRPHPAVARIVVPEAGATSFGSGTLIDVRDQFGLVVTNWHVVRDGQGEVEVIFPDGFRSKARPLKVDADWDLAALVVWRPPALPVSIAPHAPQPGDQLTICGYGSGEYRAATGRCTQYYAPRLDFPQHMVELDVEARQGDSGGPIFNERGELAGVLFGAGRGTTLGSFGGRVGSFLATLAPDIGRRADLALVERDGAMTTDGPVTENGASGIAHGDGKLATSAGADRRPSDAPHAELAALWTEARHDDASSDGWHPAGSSAASTRASASVTLSEIAWFEYAKTVLAILGAATVLMQLMRVAG